MNRNNPPRSSEALIERIRHLSAEAEWSVDELRDVLTDAGIDPDQFIKDIKTRIKELLNVSPERPERMAQDEQDEYDALPLLPRLRLITGLKATAIAEKTGTPVPFLSDLSGHPNVIPFRARKEFAKRAANNLPGVSERDVLEAFDRGLHQQAAAFRDSPFPDEEVDFEKIVRRSDMSEEQKQYWLSLSKESPE
ncbi:MAG: hypothetical protein J2P52_04145 [Blastocatellia bacterium]|nr:hypothetical protein [Blastocatellia bacterium]